MLLRQQLQQLLQLVTGLRIESDKRIIHDEQTGIGKQRLGQLELPEFPAGEGDDIFVKEWLHVEEVIQVALQLTALLAILSSQPVGFLQEFPDIGSLRVDVMLVPSQLQVVCLIHGRSVRVAKSDVAQTVTRHLPAQHFDILRLTASVTSYDCYDFLHILLTFPWFLFTKSFQPL